MIDDERDPTEDQEGTAPPEPAAEDPPAEAAADDSAAQADDEAASQRGGEDEPPADKAPRLEGEGGGAPESPAAEASEPPTAEAPAPADDEAAASADETPPPADLESESEAVAEEPEVEGGPPADAEEVVEDEPAERVKPEIPGADLEVDIVPEGVDVLALPGEEGEDEDETAAAPETDEAGEPISQPIATAAIDLGASARYTATGKRKTAVARVILKPGSGTYLVNGKELNEFFPRATLQRNIRQPLETVGYQDRMDVVAKLHGGGVSSQAGALRHGISRALLEADPNLRGELKRRGFLTRDARAKERRKAGLKKARKRPQFSKR